MSEYTEIIGTASVSIVPPTGSIMAYLGSTDPDGWVICDGVARVNTNGIYNNLITMNIGSGSLNTGNYTPPNLKAAFLRGTGTSGNYSGPALGNPQYHATQMHNHAVNDPGHGHWFVSWYDDGNNIGGGGTNGFGWRPNPLYITINLPGGGQASIYSGPQVLYTNDSVNAAHTSSEGFNVAHALTNITINDSSGNYVDVNESRPFNYGINWVIKL